MDKTPLIINLLGTELGVFSMKVDKGRAPKANRQSSLLKCQKFNL